MRDGVETRFDIKLKWNLMIRDKIKKKSIKKTKIK